MLIPAANVQHLMLREDVVEAVRTEQVLSLFGRDHRRGDRDPDRRQGRRARRRKGAIPAATVNRLVEDKLKLFAERGRAFAQKAGGQLENGKA